MTELGYENQLLESCSTINERDVNWDIHQEREYFIADYGPMGISDFWQPWSRGIVVGWRPLGEGNHPLDV